MPQVSTLRLLRGFAFAGRPRRSPRRWVECWARSVELFRLEQAGFEVLFEGGEGRCGHRWNQPKMRVCMRTPKCQNGIFAQKCIFYSPPFGSTTFLGKIFPN